MAQAVAVGIDLGTTYSAVARIDQVGRTAMMRNAEGELLTPSVVLFEDDEIVVGKEAKKMVGVAADRVAECVKRDMGNPTFSRPIRGERLPPEVIQSCILRKLKHDTVAQIGGEIRVVITVPAYFDEPRRKATADAGELAGLNVLDIVNEPTAAALAFGEQLGYLDPIGAPRQTMRVLVYDLGGGTFDVTVIELQPANVRTLATDGDVRLGGRDWDARLVEHIAGEFFERHGEDPRRDPASEARLYQVAEEVKRTLSAREQAAVHVEHAGRVLESTISRRRFDDLTEDLLERTAYTTRQVLGAANLVWSDINYILLVGGSTRMPMVSNMLERLSGRPPQHGVNPDEAVARGAAVFAGYLMSSRDERSPGPRFQVTDVNSHSLGIEGINRKTLRKENVVLIPRNTTLPKKITESFVTKRDKQQSVVVQVLEGESTLPGECTPIARAVLRNLPSLAEGTPIEVSYEYQANGRLSIRARVPSAGRELAIEMEREGGLSEERISRWKRLLEAERGFANWETMSDPHLKPFIVPANNPTAMLERATPVSEVWRASDPGPMGVAAGLAETAPMGSIGPRPIPSPGSIRPIPMGHAVPHEDSAPGRLDPQPDSHTHAPAGSGSEHASSAAPHPNTLLAPEHDFAANHVPYRPKQTSMKRMMINLTGHLIASALGLSIGYYILCYLSPESNFLRLDLPGLPPAATSMPPKK